MGFSVFTENRLHDRVYVDDPKAGGSLSRVAELAPREGILWMIDPHGDTMLNALQLEVAQRELRGLARRFSELVDDVNYLDELMESVIKRRGYLWVEGD
jgi:hypothetical protein